MKTCAPHGMKKRTTGIPRHRPRQECSSIRGDLKSKGGYYFKYVDLCNDGIYWAVMLEAQVDEREKITYRGLGQLIIRER